MAHDNEDCRLIGFDAAGYPLVGRGYARLPGQYCVKRRYGAIGITPMVLSAAPVKSGQIAVSNLPITAKPKPSPSVPAAPTDLPPQYDFCVQQSGDGTRFLRFRDPSHAMHGKDVTASSQCIPARAGSNDVTMCHGGQGDMFWEAPVCSDGADDKEPVPVPCCVELATSMLVCPGSAYDSLVVQILPQGQQKINGVTHVSVAHPDLPGGGLRAVPVCEPVDQDRPEEKPCCIEEDTGTLMCPPGSNHPLDGQIIPLEYLHFYDKPDGTRIAVINCGQVQNGPQNQIQAELLKFCSSAGGFEFLACERIPTRPQDPEIPPGTDEPVPDICCFDPKTSTLICEGTAYHGLAVSLVTIATLPNGTKVASVAFPGGGMRVPICEAYEPPDISTLPDIPPDEIPVPEPEEPPVGVIPIPEPEEPPVEVVPDLPPPSPGIPQHCCYNRATQSIECPGTDLHRLKVRLVQSGAVQNGWPMVKVEHPRFSGGYAVMPECKTACEGTYRPSQPGPSCADKWEAEMQRVARSSDEHCPGRRYAAISNRGTGINPREWMATSKVMKVTRNENYGRFPGMRGYE